MSRLQPLFNPASPQHALKQSWRQRTGGGFKWGDDPTAATTSSSTTSAEASATLALYAVRCEHLGVEAEADVCRVLASGASVLSLTERALSEAELAAIAYALRNDTRVRELHLRACSLSRASGGELADLLRVNVHLTVLDLAENERLGDAGLAPIATALRESNVTLQRLVLANTGLSDASAPRLADVLAVNQRCALDCLDLQRNAFSDVGITALAAALKNNRRLQTLVLRFNHVGDAGAAALGTALSAGHAPVRELDLGGNRIGSLGMIGLARAFETLQSQLERLNVRQNACDDAGAAALVRAAASSQLRELYLGLNRLTARGVEQVFDILRTSAAAKLCTIDLQAAPVDAAAARVVAEFLRTDTHLQELVLAPLEQDAVNAEALELLASSLWQNKSLLTWHMGDIDAHVGDDQQSAKAVESIRMTVRVNRTHFERDGDAAWHAAEPLGDLQKTDLIDAQPNGHDEPVQAEPEAQAEEVLQRAPAPAPAPAPVPAAPEPETVPAHEPEAAPELSLSQLRTSSPPLSDVKPRQYRQLPPEPAPLPDESIQPRAEVRAQTRVEAQPEIVAVAQQTPPAPVPSQQQISAPVPSQQQPPAQQQPLDVAVMQRTVDQAMAFYFAEVQRQFLQVEQRLATLDSRLHAVETQCIELNAARQAAVRSDVAVEERVVERVSRATNELQQRVARVERLAKARLGDAGEHVAGLPALQAKLAETLLRVDALETALVSEQAHALQTLDAMLLHHQEHGPEGSQR